MIIYLIKQNMNQTKMRQFHESSARKDLDYSDAMNYLMNHIHEDVVTFSKELTLCSIQMIVRRKRNIFGKNMYSLYFVIPRIYDEIWDIRIHDTDMCKQDHYVVVENHIIPYVPSEKKPIRIVNHYRTYIRVDMHQYHARELFHMHTLAISFHCRVYSIERQKKERQVLETYRLPWYYMYPYDIPLDSSLLTIYLLDDFDIRFFETDFYGIQRVRGSRTLTVLIATQPRRHVLYELLFSQFPFQVLRLVDHKYPSKLTCELITDKK